MTDEPCPVTGFPCGECYIACEMQMSIVSAAMSTMSDADKHAKALRETGMHAVFLPASLYAAAEKLGYDMTRYVVNRMLPMSTGPDDCTGGPDALKQPSTSELMCANTIALMDAGDTVRRMMPTGRPDEKFTVTHTCGLCGGPLPCLTHSQPVRGVRKHVGKKDCGGVTCLPGKNGKCVACADWE